MATNSHCCSILNHLLIIFRLISQTIVDDDDGRDKSLQAQNVMESLKILNLAIVGDSHKDRKLSMVSGACIIRAIIG